jgi:hypothetical protein
MLRKGVKTVSDRDFLDKGSVAFDKPLVVQKGSNRYPEDVNMLIVGRRLFYYHAQYSIEYIEDTDPTKDLLHNLQKRNVDLFTFVHRSFMMPVPKYSFPHEDEPIALLKIRSFENWWGSQIRTEERNRIRKAEKKGVWVKTAEINENFIKSAQKIYNETPIRQGRRYVGYGLSLSDVREKFRNLQRSEVLGAYFNNELIGLLWMVYGDRVARIRSFLSLIKHRDKAPNNALMAQGVRRCCEKGFRFIVYEKMGYLPGLDSFKTHNGFKECVIPRYYIPLSKKGILAIKLRIHREIQYSLSPRMARALLPLYSLASQAIPPSIWQRLSD